eukprot:Hpha_TRINITY_DN13770_c0_g1::TRINITY_DN13770_c0_g1_i1::g.142437::m.142437
MSGGGPASPLLCRPREWQGAEGTPVREFRLRVPSAYESDGEVSRAERRQGVPRVATTEFARMEERRRRQRREQVKAQMQGVEQECTFRPKINHSSKGSRSARSSTPAFERLYPTHLSAPPPPPPPPPPDEECEKENVGRGKGGVETKRAWVGTGQAAWPVAEDAQQPPLILRLFEDASVRRRRFQLRQKEHTAKEVDGLFKPQLNFDPGSVHPEQKPLHERWCEVVRQKKENIRRLQEKEDEECRFVPQIHPLSVVATADRAPLIERLTQHQQPVLRSVEERVVNRKPAIGARTRALAARREEYQRTQGFVERQECERVRREKRLECLKEERDAEDAPKRDSVRVTEREVQRKLREMQLREKAKVERLSRQRAQELEGYFKPNAGRRRSSSASSRPREGYRAELVHEGVARMAEELREREQQACTFAPTIDSRSKKIAADRPRAAATSTAKNPTRERERRVRDELLEEQQAEVLAQCTFQPRLAPTPATAGPAPRVPGLNQYLQRQERARAKEDDRRRREESAHRVKPSALHDAVQQDLGGRVYTVARPFALATSNKRSSSAPPPSFHPSTNEGERQRVLQRMLEEDEDASDRPGLMGGVVGGAPVGLSVTPTAHPHQRRVERVPVETADLHIHLSSVCDFGDISGDYP